MPGKTFILLAAVGMMSLITNIVLTFRIMNAEKISIESSTIDRKSDAEIGAVWRAAYNQAIEDAETENQKSYEEGYHKATEDMSCPAGGSANLDGVQLPEKK